MTKARTISTPTRREALAGFFAAGTVAATTAGMAGHALQAAPADPIGDLVQAADDPLFVALARRQAAVDVFNSSSVEDDDAVDALADETFMPIERELLDNCPVPTTLAGAKAGLAAADRILADWHPELALAILQAVRVYVDRMEG